MTPENPSATPCPTCHQYDHSSLGEGQVTNAFLHFQAMCSHRGDGTPTQFVFDEATRDAAQVLMAAARATPAQHPKALAEAILRLRNWADLPDDADSYPGIANDIDLVTLAVERLSATPAQDEVAGWIVGNGASAAAPPPSGDAVELVKPWADFRGDLPEYDHPLRCVFESGIDYAVRLLAETLKVDDWQYCDGTEEFDGDLGGTMFNIVLAAMPKDEAGDEIHPNELPAVIQRSTLAALSPVPATPRMPTIDQVCDDVQVQLATPAQDEVELVNSGLLRIARSNLRHYIKASSFKCEADREAAANCLDVIEEEVDGLTDLVAVLRSAVAAYNTDEVERGNEPPEWLAPLCDIYEQTTGDKPKSAGIMQVALSTPPPVAASEPVAWMYENESGDQTFEFNPNGDSARWLIENGYTETPLYALSPQPEGEG